MGGSGKRGGDRILESRHLVGLFLGVVILCGVFFTLGYVMGHTQYDSAVHAADATAVRPEAPAHPKAKAAQPEKTPAPAVGEWDFYSKKDNDHLQPAPKAVLPAAPAAGPSEASPAANGPSPSHAAEKPAVTPTKLPAHYQPPRMTKSSIVLQLAALRRQSDALAMADALQQKRFPSFVVAPTADNFYRVQVGPYSTVAQAEAAKRELDRLGFKAIIKR